MHPRIPPCPESWNAARRTDAYPRREHRYQVDLRATVTRFALPAVSVSIRSISPHGAHGESDELLRIGSTVMLDLPNLVGVGAQVRWALGSQFGLRFLHAEEQPLEGQLYSYLGSLGLDSDGFKPDALRIASLRTRLQAISDRS
jgi:hypothetical protein